ncbi:MAG: indole-3-glycerol phosphate synthase TrpC [Alphaproteobacteria bacterium CG_4_10_14_0_2_um_filter_63_37]|nr:MAG: indole-3-glycerol phosphate synthase [Proteobacteria bacterium CG1_02_64_396]PJA24139.1 MAG: indole-3-glycerol phosphate synthase TrpC [Alphaproteobacteria bacterium CG_4_10_14_0_2_um_filter_63_37]
MPEAQGKPDILATIMQTKLEEVAAARAQVDEAALERAIAERLATRPIRPFAAALKTKGAVGAAVIAEVKKASPSKGIIRADFDPVAIAQSYERGGAAALSVLTDRPYFQGSPEYLQVVSNTVSLPVLRKDFIRDRYQILEALAWGADAILLIAAALPTEQLADLYYEATSRGLDVLIEIHNAQEWEAVAPLKPTLIGINNRDLRTFVTDLAVTESLLPHFPAGTFVVSESGIHSRDDVQRLLSRGVHGFLIGESLMRHEDPGTKLAELLV